jgi:hypothetical protein
MWRSSNGNMRLDTLHTSLISMPAAQQAILLDHLKKEATIIPVPPAPSDSSKAASPHVPASAAPLPHLQVQDLGKNLIEGHEVEGKRYRFTPPLLPQAPKPPQVPQAPGVPGAPPSAQAPKPPQVPKLPLPTVTEIWTSVKLKTPVLTKVTSPAGGQTIYCKPTSTEEPHPSLFQIPPGYKLKKP